MTEIIHHAINEHLPLYLDHCGLPHFNPTSSKNPCMYSAGIIMELYKQRGSFHVLWECKSDNNITINRDTSKAIFLK